MQPARPLLPSGRPRAAGLVVLALAALAAATLAGCGTLRSWAEIGPGLKPSLGTSVSVPLGK